MDTTTKIKKKGKTRIHRLFNGNRNSSYDLKKSEYPCGFFDELGYRKIAEEQNLYYCARCGEEFANAYNYCPNCGTKKKGENL